MVLAALCEQYLPQPRGLARNHESLAAANDGLLWQQHHYRNASFKRSHEHDNNKDYRRNSMLDISGPEDDGAISSSSNNNNSNIDNMMPFSITASTRPRRNRCKASKFLASLAADFDVLTDWLFYFHCRNENVEYFKNEGNYENYKIPPWMVGVVLASCLIGTTLWLILATDGAIVTPVLRALGYDKLSLGHILLCTVVFEDLPQIVLTFFIEDYFEEDQEFNNYAVMNVVASLYDILIKLAEAYDQRADIVETGHWCKDSISAHDEKIICLVPIPEDSDEEENVENTGVTAGAGSIRNSVHSRNTSGNSMYSRDSISSTSLNPAEVVGVGNRQSSNSSLFQNKLHVSNPDFQQTSKKRRRRTLLQEAKEIVADTKLPSMRFLSASKDGTVKFWDTSVHDFNENGQRKPCEQFEGHDRRVSCISFVRKLRSGEENAASTGTTKSSYFFLTGSYDGTSKLWKTSDTKCLKTYIKPSFGDESALKIEVTSIAYIQCEHEGYIKPSYVSPAVSTSSEYFVTGYKSGKVRLWDMWSGACLKIFEEPTNPSRRFFRLYRTKRKSRIYSLCSMEDSRHFVAGSLDGSIKMWDLGIDSNNTNPMEEGVINTIAESDECNSGDLTTTMSTITTSSIIDTPAQVFIGHTSTVFSIKCVSPGSVLLSGSQDYTAKLWSVSTGACLKTFFGHDGPIHDVAIVDQVTYLTASRDKTIKAWDAISGDAFRTYENNRTSHQPVTAVATGDLPGCFLSGDENGTVGLWIFSAVHDQHDRGNLLGIDEEVMVCGGCQGDEEIVSEEINDARGYTRIT